MKHYLIKSINAIVSDAEILENDYFLDIDKMIYRFQPYKMAVSLQCKKIEYSNNNLEGLKPFELVDEEIEKILQSIEEIWNGGGKDEHDDDGFEFMEYSELSDAEVNTYKEGLIDGYYKAKASAFTEEDMIAFAEWVNKLSKPSFANLLIDKELLTLYLQEQESRMIEVIQISENQFKIK